uniref:hypothetical protein n=1 Tax=Acetatifactor sp. TaxID=1872090 RepID=UPI004057004D
MKLATTAIVTVLAIEKKEATKDFGESYKMAIMQGTEVGSFSCTKEAYETAEKNGLMKVYKVGVQLSEYQGKKTERITGVSEHNGK